jgi:pimeloyl-ACP methyl ester carboxylesterase
MSSLVHRFIVSAVVVALLSAYLPSFFPFRLSFVQWIVGTVQSLVFGVILAVVLAIGWPLFRQSPPKRPELKDQWFGRQEWKDGQPLPVESTDIVPYEVNVEDQVLDDLRERLERDQIPEPLFDSKFNYGFNGHYLRKVIDYWRRDFDWRRQEKLLNSLPQFKTQIQGLGVHFLHVKPSLPAKKVVPLLVIHGWPGSVWEYYKSIPLLTQPNQDLAFEVICPSIPGYGFSEAPHRQGFGLKETARVFVQLMNRLGHKRFLVHGGDWGSIITKTIARLYPENVIGIHTTMGSSPLSLRGKPLLKFIVGTVFPSLVLNNSANDAPKVYPFWPKFAFLMRESGYMHIQATKPDTVGTALLNTPVGLAAYILEKYSTWTNPAYVDKQDGGLTEKFTLDELLTQIMIYWTSRNVTASLRYYKESLNTGLRLPITVPAAVADFPHELVRTPESWVRDECLDLVQYTEMSRGGHFGAFEEPELTAQDIRKFAITLQNRH